LRYRKVRRSIDDQYQLLLNYRYQVVYDFITVE